MFRLSEEEFTALSQRSQPAPIKRRAPQPTEAQEQAALIAWAHLYESSIPELRLLFHIPNGGKRNIREAAKFKKLGVLRGVPDLFLAVACGGFHGLWIEMKKTKGQISKEQRHMLRDLEAGGYRVAVCYSWLEAQAVILEYCSGRPSEVGRVTTLGQRAGKGYVPTLPQ